MVSISLGLLGGGVVVVVVDVVVDVDVDVIGDVNGVGGNDVSGLIHGAFICSYIAPSSSKYTFL